MFETGCGGDFLVVEGFSGDLKDVRLAGVVHAEQNRQWRRLEVEHPNRARAVEYESDELNLLRISTPVTQRLPSTVGVLSARSATVPAMAFRDLTDSTAVRRALAEFDELGRQAFLAK